MNIAGIALEDARPVAGGDICRAWQGRLADRLLFGKTLPRAPTDFFIAEARGLALLKVDGAPPVPDIVAVADDGLVLEWVEPGLATRAAAEDFGRRLAALHSSSRPTFGAADDGYIGRLTLPNAELPAWPQFYVERRIKPYLSALSDDERRPAEEVCERIERCAGPVEPPARIHGDLWSGNLLWSSDSEVWLVDPASAHGQEVSPLAEGWPQRVPLHRLHRLLVHATMFDGGYGARAAAVAMSALASPSS
jgi:fructosamine-3-kinase